MSSEFRPTAPSAETVFYRSYSRRKADGSRESFEEAMNRAIDGIAEVGKLGKKDTELIRKQALAQHAFPSGRAFWVAGSQWSKEPSNFYGYYNCSSVHIQDLKAFGLLMDMAMQGTGTGAVLEQETIAKLPVVRNRIEIIEVVPLGDKGGNPTTNVLDKGDHCVLQVGDSRQGWVDAYQGLINSAFSEEQFPEDTIRVVLDLSQVRPAGERLKGFGGTANPIKLEEMFRKVAALLSSCYGRKLSSVEACLLIDEAAACVVAGNIRRSAGMRQGSSTDQEFIHAKEGLYTQDAEGNWKVDPTKEALRMANHTVCYHTKPTLEEVRASVEKQFYSGEGAIQYVPEAIARANVDLLPTPAAKDKFIRLYEGHGKDNAKQYLQLQAQQQGQKLDERELEHRITRYGLNPCAEVVMRDNLCNLAEVHLNTIDPKDTQAQYDAFYAAGIQVAALLKHKFVHERIQYSREIDPIVGVSFTGLFDFFVTAFGTNWLEWMFNDRPEGALYRFEERERYYLEMWREAAYDGVKYYCDKHKVRMPNRWTVVQPAGCLDKDALRVFDQGLLFADELVSPGSGETPNLELTVRQGLGASKGLANAPLDLVKLKFKNGRTLRLTPDHRLSVDSSWVQAKDMQLGMRLDYSLGEYQKTEEAALQGINSANYTREARQEAAGHMRGVLAKDITTPETMSPELGYFLGALFGNGCLSNKPKRLRFAHADMVVLNKLADIAVKLFDVNPTWVKETNQNELCLASKQLHDWFLLNSLQKPSKSAYLDRIPQALRKSSKESILAFFAGLIDTDGCARSGSFSIDTASESFMRHLQQIGEAVGLCFGLSNNTKGSNFQKNKSIWTLHLSRTRSNWTAIEYLNTQSIKLQRRPVAPAKMDNGYQPYEVVAVEFEQDQPDYTYEFAVEVAEDDDAWYWQGAIKSHNSKSLLTGASSGWHPPYAQRFIRRITLGVQDPLVSALRDWGYSLVPAPSARDDEGNLLNDIGDPRVREVLVEIPTEVPWANLPGADSYDLNQLSAVAQMRLYMNVQRHYTTHTTSATISFRENEIDALAQEIYGAIGTGYIGVALLARFDANATFPRLPMEPISKERYQELMEAVQAWRLPEDEELGFLGVLAKYDRADYELVTEAACTSAACIARAEKDEQEGKA